MFHPCSLVVGEVPQRPLTGIDSQLPENPFVVVGGSKARNRRPNILGIYIPFKWDHLS